MGACDGPVKKAVGLKYLNFTACCSPAQRASYTKLLRFIVSDVTIGEKFIEKDAQLAQGGIF